MSRGNCGHNEYEYQQEREARLKSVSNASYYKQSYLHLRKIMREYSRSTGHVFPDDIKKAIGMK